MKIEQCHWTEKHGWRPSPPGKLGASADLVLLFGSRNLLEKGNRLKELTTIYPGAYFTGCSTSGEIFDTQVNDDSLSITAIHFENTKIQGACVEINSVEESYEAGQKLIQSIDHKNLVHAFVLSEGININGSELVKGLTSHLPSGVTVTGGLSGDGDRFKKTVVIADQKIKKNSATIVGFYGRNLKVGYGCLGGWDPFGPERLITRSKGNILYELDHQSALNLYKTYLGVYAKDLPASGLLFPLSLKTSERNTGVVRTILSIDEKEESMTFAGDVPTGSYAQLMKANFDRLIDGAYSAAKTSYEAIGSIPPDLAILISCVGRKMVLKQRVEEEVESVRDVLGQTTALIGFYSYGEISPFTPDAKCELHNQTMTITTFSER